MLFFYYYILCSTILKLFKQMLIKMRSIPECEMNFISIRQRRAKYSLRFGIGIKYACCFKNIKLVPLSLVWLG